MDPLVVSTTSGNPTSPRNVTTIVGANNVAKNITDVMAGTSPTSSGDLKSTSRRKQAKAGRSAEDGPGVVGSYGIQFTLGDGDEAAGEEQIQSVSPHPLFCEMEELRKTSEGFGMEWKETARWIKFEEDVEDGGNRWSKPFVATLPLRSLLELRSHVSHPQSAILLDVEVQDLPFLCDLIINDLVSSSALNESYRDQVRDILLRRHRHQFEGLGDHKNSYAIRQLSGIGRSISHGIFSMKHNESSGIPSVLSGDRIDKGSQPKVTKVTSVTSVSSTGESDGMLTRNTSKGNLNISKKLPKFSESATILVGEVEFVPRPICAFVRIMNHICLGNLTEVNVPTRFIFLLLGPIGSAARYHEVGRAMGAMCSDEVFQQYIYKAKTRKDVTDALDEFLNEVTVLPPGEWDPQIRIEPPKKLPLQNNRKRSPEGSIVVSSLADDKKEEVTVTRTGRIFGGLIEDVKRKAPFYLSDFKDGLALQSIASVLFLYFATLTPVVTFGAVLGVHTDNNMAAMESILSAAVVGIIWALVSGQPLIIMGSTGPVLIFEAIVTTTCRTYALDYLPIRFWIGMWTGFFLLIMVAADASYLVRYITRFTEEGFAALISFIFVFESLEKLSGIRKTRNVCVYPNDCPGLYDQCRCNISGTFWDLDHNTNLSRSWCRANDGVLSGPGCNYSPDVLFLSIILFFGTFFVCWKLKNFRSQPYFQAKVRQVVSDFSVTAAIILMSVVDFYLGLDTPKLSVPAGLTPTIHDRSWIVDPFGNNPWWTSLVAIVPALFAVILIFMDQQITAVIINRPENKLVKGCGYHLDLLTLTFTIFFCAVMGLPWMVAATVLSINHVNSLKMESECKAPGEAPQFVSVRENRLTTLCIYLLIGASVFMTPLLSNIPLPVLYGVFLFMGISALSGLQFVDRLAILVMPMKYQPDYIYLRHVPIRRVHLFTLIQTVCLALLWVLKSFDATSMLFPLMVLALVGIRKLMDFVFKQRELAVLDDLMPETTRRKKEDAKKSDTFESTPTQGSKHQIFESESTCHVNVSLPNGHVIKFPKIGTEETTEKHVNSHACDNAKNVQPKRRHHTENEEDKSPRPKSRWSKADKKTDGQAQTLIPKLGSTITAKPKHEQIPEETDSLHLSCPIITVCPATPTQSIRSLNLGK